MHSYMHFHIIMKIITKIEFHVFIYSFSHLLEKITKIEFHAFIYAFSYHHEKNYKNRISCIHICIFTSYKNIISCILICIFTSSCKIKSVMHSNMHSSNKQRSNHYAFKHAFSLRKIRSHAFTYAQFNIRNSKFHALFIIRNSKFHSPIINRKSKFYASSHSS